MGGCVKKTNSGMGHSKHRTSGYSGRSPRYRHLLELEADQASKAKAERGRKLKSIQDPKQSVAELFGNGKKKKSKK
jgi:hypothetical protein